MASMNLLLSRLLALIRYGQWSQSDAVDLFMALMKQYKNLTEPDFVTQISTTLYQIEIHKINKSDLISGTEPGQFVDNIEAQVNHISKNSREKTLEEILEEIRAQGTVDENILGDVKDIVSSVSLRCSSSPPSTPTQGKDLKDTLFKLCTAVKKFKGWFPRQTQMVSWCILVLSGSSRLVQVGTGEGKSCIVAMFAAYGAIKGQSVDIISSSPVLAERDAEEWRPFYKELKITVDVNTNKKRDQDLKKCYACKVVYGTTQSFAGDWLRQRFHRKDVRPGREFQRVIVDEVDSLMLDKGPEVVYLSTEMPTMQTLNAILAEIWCAVNQKTQDTSDDKALRETLEERIKADISSAQMKQSDSQIPGFLEHINSKLGTWIDNALLAKTMTLGHEYILHGDTVVPVDYQSTGVVQNNMTWGDGLQQFLEMKHQTRLTDMSVITNFKSNVSLFKKYKRIYGLTGTLGNQTELDTLTKLYSGIKTCQIPSFKPRKLYEEDGIVITDEDEWIQKICSVVKEQVSPTVYRGARAALVICETIKRAETIHRALKETLPAPNLKLYTNNNMDNSDVTDNTVTAGNVIIATNLAGRGTDLKVRPEVNEAGGLFVIITFLPLNVRVENQAFGRTARQGSPGSAQLIICSTHFSESPKPMAIQTSPHVLLRSFPEQNPFTPFISESIEKVLTQAFKVYQKNPHQLNCKNIAHALKLCLIIKEPGGLTSLEVVKQARNTMVEMKQPHFLEKDIPKILKKEELFSDYLDLLDTIYSKNVWGIRHENIVSSLHECWAMWLLTKFKEDEPIETLRQQLKKDLQSAKHKLQSKQSPSSMVYHYIRSGNRLRQQGRLQESMEMYTTAVEEDLCWVAIALYNRALSTLKQRDPGYIDKALADLVKAGTEVESYMKELLLTVTHVQISSNGTMKNDSLFIKQFKVKQQVQEKLKMNIQEAVKTLKMVKSRGGDVQVTEKHVLRLVLDCVLKSPRSTTELRMEVMNLSLLGLDTIFSLDIDASLFGRLKNLFH